MQQTRTILKCKNVFIFPFNIKFDLEVINLLCQLFFSCDVFKYHAKWRTMCDNYTSVITENLHHNSIAQNNLLNSTFQNTHRHLVQSGLDYYLFMCSFFLRVYGMLLNHRKACPLQDTLFSYFVYYRPPYN